MSLFGEQNLSSWCHVFPCVNGIWLQGGEAWVPPRTAPHSPVLIGGHGRCPLEGFPFLILKVLSSALDRKVSEFIVQSSCILCECDIFRIRRVKEENMRIKPLVWKSVTAHGQNQELANPYA